MNAFLHDYALPWANAFVMAFLPIVASVLAAWAVQQMKRRNMDTQWFEAISRAGGEAYKELVASGRPVTDRTALIAAALAGADYLKTRVGPIVAGKGLSPEALAQIAGAELGKLLAVDSTVGPGSANTVTATAGPGQTATAEVGPVVLTEVQ